MLKLTNITKKYVVTKELTVNALNGINIDFRNNEFVSILGPSGCGKTTLLNIIGGLDRYTDGNLSIDNVSTTSYSDQQWNSYRNQRIGFVFQSYNLIPHQTIAENVELALTIGGVSKDIRRQRAIEVLTEVGLKDEISKRPNQLSGGQMQRVAIARALVNNPEIILADEPTGALDSVTSRQVMKLLKKVAEKHLVIMVTHNGELAQQFSTRIIRLTDGLVIDDTNPYQYTLCEQPKDNVTDGNGATKSHTKRPNKKVRMSFFTALSLSFKNLLTKKGRTVMTSLAGSIGIIGVALVLALSNGFNLYIDNLQSDTLSGYPVAVNNIATDINAIYDNMMPGQGQGGLPTFPNGDNNIHLYDPMAKFDGLVHYNYITQEYIDYIEQYYTNDQQQREDKQTLNSIKYSYATKINVFSRYDEKYRFVSQSNADSSNPMSSFMGDGEIFQELLDNSEFVNTQYEVLQGKYPTESNEIAIVVDSRNRIAISTIKALGIDYQSMGTGKDTVYSDISFDEIINKEFYVAYADDYYTTANSGMSYTTPRALDADPLHSYLGNLVDNNSAKKLNVVGVMRVNPEAAINLYSTGIVYTPKLTEELLQHNLNSNITKAQQNAKASNKVYIAVRNDDNNFATTLTAIDMSKILAGMDSGENTMLKLTEDQAYLYYWQMTDSSGMPTKIAFYTKDFDSKDVLLAHLDAWNTTEQGQSNKIMYTDATAMLSSTMGQMIDIISYVLIAFASISLIVSSVMIGIITYVSVIERTKEIGVLRSIGASKRDVSNVFSAESFLIGITAGVLGVAITYLLCIPVNLILISVAGGALTTNLAVLNPIAALVLICISFTLTLISGFFPSRYAAKVDPVKALRTE